jgi:hypothetical protein
MELVVESVALHHFDRMGCVAQTHGIGSSQLHDDLLIVVRGGLLDLVCDLEGGRVGFEFWINPSHELPYLEPQVG